MGKHGEGTLYKKRGRGCWRVRWMFEGKLHDESTGGISIKGKKADEVYDEVCEKMTSLRKLIVPIRDKYVKK
jgi:hypothetical protein